MTTPGPTFDLAATDEQLGGKALEYCTAGTVVGLVATPNSGYEYVWSVEEGSILELPAVQKTKSTVHWDTAGASGIRKATVQFFTPEIPGNATTPATPAVYVGEDSVTINIRQSPVVQQVDSLPVSMRRTNNMSSTLEGFWAAIQNRTKAMRFEGSGYNSFISRVLGAGDMTALQGSQNLNILQRQRDELLAPVQGVGAYELLKTATQVFLLMEAGVVIEEKDRYTAEQLYDSSQEASRLGRPKPLNAAKKDLENYLRKFLNVPHLPYIVNILTSLFGANQVTGMVFDGPYLKSRAANPLMLELISSYWLEEGMLVQTINAICMRFQNRRNGSGRDPLAHMEIAPLYPINNLLWGYIQDEINRLSIQRRAYEYDHHYGITLYGKAIPDFNPADSRSKFLEAFHNLLLATAAFYKRDDDATVMADAFPLLNALKEVHLILAQGAHNQFGDLPWTARVEMLMQQYILARPEIRKFLQSREMVPYKESWMAQVDTMKTIQGWTDVSITHFQSLAECGEKLLLSIRYGDWVRSDDVNQASSWARYWRPEIQSYIHAYRACTGVDITAENRDSRQLALLSTQPGILLKQRLTEGPARLPAPVDNAPVAGFRNRKQQSQSAPRQLP